MQLKQTGAAIVIAAAVNGFCTANANADVTYTYTGLPMQAVVGTAFSGQYLTFSFTVPTFLPPNFGAGGYLGMLPVQVTSWNTSIGTYSTSSNSSNSFLPALRLQTDSSDLITEWEVVADTNATASAPSVTFETEFDEHAARRSIPYW